MSEKKQFYQQVRATAVAHRLQEIHGIVEAQLGEDFISTCQEYYNSIRSFMRRNKMNPLAVASFIGEKINSEGGNPLVFIAACVQFTKDHPSEL